MRKLKLQVQISVDGFIAGPAGEMDWMEWNWDQALKDYISEITAPADCIVLGRKLAQDGFIKYWETHPEEEGAAKINGTKKIIFSKTLTESEWTNTIVANGDLVEEVMQLKTQKGGDIIVYGGAAFISSLIENGLIDEYHLFINPTAVGSGKPIFTSLKNKQDLKLVKSIAFACGIVLLNYEPKRGYQ